MLPVTGMAILHSTGMVFFAGLLIVLGGIVLQIRWSGKQRIKKITKGKLEAEAIILSIHKTGLYINDQPQVRVQVQVQPEWGRNFVFEANAIIQSAVLDKLCAGSKVLIQYNPGNLKEVLFL